MALGRVFGGLSHELSSIALEALPIPVFAIDDKHKVFIWNRACQDLTGIPASEAIGTSNHWKVFYSEPKPTIADALVDGRIEANFGDPANWGNGASSPSVARYVGWCEFPDKQRRYVSVRAVALHSERGTRIGALVALDDLTEWQRMHEREVADEVRRREAMKMDALGRMAGGIAHDFNNLLTAILGYGRLLKDALGRGHPLLADVEEILNAGARGAHLTQQLLAISRKRMTSPRVVRVGALLADLLPSLRQLAGKNVQLRADCQSEPWPVMGDVSLLEQVIVHLTENARDSMPNGGTLRIEIANETVSEARRTPWSEMPAGPYVRLTVEDTGCGVPDHVMAHLFEPFFTTKDQRQGMGLAVVWGILRQMRAHIEVHSTIGHGTRFHVYFPAHTSEDRARSHERESKEEARGGQETILVAEDEDIVRHLVVFMLKSLGYRVLEASNGREALKIASHFEGPIHLVLTDVVMPHMGGLELVKELRPIRKDFKVLYMSGFTDGRLLDQGLLESDSEIILKPYTRESLARKIRAVLDRKS